MANKKRKMMSVMTPDIRTIYLGSGYKQKAKYLQLQKDFGKRQLEDDIDAGAVIYESFIETLKLNGTKYTFITAPTEEDGMRAVSYLAGIHAEMLNYSNNDLAEALTDELNAIDDTDEYFDYDDLKDDEEYCEEFDRIPIINMRDVIAEENNNSPVGGFGVFNMELQNNISRIEPWWKDCVEQAVCVVKNNEAAGMFFNGEELLTSQEIESLKRFSDNEKVYVLLVDSDIKEQDFSLTTAALEYTANVYRIDDRYSVRRKYYRCLLENAAYRRGFSFSKALDISLLTDKLSKIDKNHPCREFEKIMDYLIHIDAPKRLDSNSFSRFGLKEIIQEVSDRDITVSLDKELVGMDSVKSQVNNVMNMLRFVKLRAARNITNSQFHNVHLFIGAPGTAKTTVAKMMANMMQKEGLIKGNRFISVTGAELKGAFVGQTAPKVHELFQQYDAIFIDEAYSLACSNDFDGSIDAYSQEGLAQLAVELEEHATDKLVIFAGYGGKNVSKKNNLMNKFLKANPGISSRINSTIFFDSYTPEDMVSIVHHIAGQAQLTFPKTLDKDIMAYFATRQNESDFGNGREARVFLECCERYLAERVAGKDPEFITDKELNTVVDDDIYKAIDVLKEKRKNELGQSGKRIGYI